MLPPTTTPPVTRYRCFSRKAELPKSPESATYRNPAITANNFLINTGEKSWFDNYSDSSSIGSPMPLPYFWRCSACKRPRCPTPRKSPPASSRFYLFRALFNCWFLFGGYYRSLARSIATTRNGVVAEIEIINQKQTHRKIQMNFVANIFVWWTALSLISFVIIKTFDLERFSK